MQTVNKDTTQVPETGGLQVYRASQFCPPLLGGGEGRFTQTVLRAFHARETWLPFIVFPSQDIETDLYLLPVM